jgi:hypothetical protein
MTQTEALRLALEALEAIIHWYGVRDKNDVMMPPLNQNPEIKESMDAITAIKAALEAKDDPVAYINVEQRKLEWAKYISWDTPTVVNLPKIPLYTTPPQRQPLTDDEIQNALLGYRLVDAIDIVRAIEAAHGIKGET